MNFLQLTQKLRQECGVAGTGPVSVVGQVNEAKRLVDYVRDAWLEIQGLHDDWNFLREEFEFTVLADTPEITPTDAGVELLREWDIDTFRNFATSAGVADEQFMVEWDYYAFRDTYRYAAQTPGRPLVFAIKPADKSIMFGPVPEQSYTIRGECTVWPTPLAADNEVPKIPANLHMVIVYKAMQFYGLYESAPEVLERGKTGYKALLAQLERNQLPGIRHAEPLA